MALTNQFWEELQEEGDNQQADMHTVHIGIGSHNHLIISQRVHALLNIEGSLEQIELLVLIDHLFRQAKGVQGLSSQREDGLGVHVATLGDRTTGRVTLSNKDA